MAWSGGTYRKGNYGTNGWTGDASLGIGIEAGRHDTQDDDFANGINACLAKDGSNSASGNLNIGSNRVTNLGTGTARNDAATVAQVQDRTSSYLGTTGGTSTAFTVTATPTITALTTGAQYVFKANAANGASATLKIDGTAATTMQRQGTALAGNEFKANDMVSVVYDGTNFQITNISTAPLFVDRTNNRVGIGTTAPTVPLHVVGDGTVTGQFSNQLNSQLFFRLGQYTADSASGQIEFVKSRNTTVGGHSVVSNGDDIFLLNCYASDGSAFKRAAYILAEVGTGTISSTSMPGDLSFGTTANGSVNTTERMRITSAGDVGIGTSSPSYKLQISTDSAAKPTTNTWTIASDSRIKTNVENYTKGLAEICQIRPITYDYNGKGGFPAGPGGISILAQEIQPVFPECVGSFKGKLNEDDKEETDILNYNGHAITFALINAVKELNAKVESLEARIAALEA